MDSWPGWPRRAAARSSSAGAPRAARDSRSRFRPSSRANYRARPIELRRSRPAASKRGIHPPAAVWLALPEPAFRALRWYSRDRAGALAPRRHGLAPNRQCCDSKSREAPGARNFSRPESATRSPRNLARRNRTSRRRQPRDRVDNRRAGHWRAQSERANQRQRRVMRGAHPRREDPDAKPTLGFALPGVGEKNRMRRYAPVRTMHVKRAHLGFGAGVGLSILRAPRIGRCWSCCDLSCGSIASHPCDEWAGVSVRT